jgi:tetratricopeptide (TPR) repeat protein
LEECKTPQFAICVLSFLSYCEYGLQEDDLRVLFSLLNNVKWVQLDYIEFLEQFSLFVRVRENGRLDISHDIIRNTLCELFSDNKNTICSLITMYLLYKNNHDFIAIRTFLDIAFKGAQYKRFSEFVVRFKNTFSSKESDQSMLASEIKNGIQRLFLEDDGRFIFTAMKSYRSLEDIACFQMIVSSSLLSINDFHDEDTILKIVYAVMFLPMQLDLFDDVLFDIEKRSCERFMRRHSVSRAKIDEFMDYCKKPTPKLNRNCQDQKSNTDGSLEVMIRDMHTAEDPADRSVILIKLSKMARSMASNTSSAGEAEKVSFEMIKALKEENIGLDNFLKEIMEADVYTILGVVYKTLKEWDKGIHYDQLSLDIYKKIYENTPTEEMFKKYRERVYNIANITEAWAMTEKNNTELWNRTKERYEDCYALELTAISQGLAERDVLQSASSILSLGTALINIGRHEDGMEKYDEGIAIIKNAARNNSNVDIYTELSIHLLECIYQLLICEKQKAAYELASNISSYLSFVVGSDFAELIDKINDICCAFSNGINDIIRKYHDCDDLGGQLIASRILCNIYEAILPIAPYEVKVNIIITRCNICAILFWNLMDYSKAYDEFQELLNFVLEHDLAAPDENGHCSDEANSRLVDAYARSLMCLERLDRQEELKSLIEKGTQWAEYFADHLEIVKGDVPRVLYEIFTTLMRNKSQLALLFLMMAFNAITDDSYDKKAHPETVMMILKIVSELGGEDG